MINALKKVVLSFLIAFSAFAGANAFAYEILNEESAMPEEILRSIGIIDDNFNVTSSVTRGEFVYLASKIFSTDSIKPLNTSPFSDVSKNHEYYTEICWIYQLGYAKGNEEGFFEPNREITYGEALKLSVMLLGYGNMAQAHSGYPTGFMWAGASLSITDKINLSVDDKLTFEDACQLINSVLLAEPYDNTFEEAKNDNRDKSEKTLLYRRFSIKKIEALVTSDGITSIEDMPVCSSGEVRLGDDVYENLSNASISYLLGANVLAYVSKNQDDGDKLYFVKAYKSDIIRLYREDIDSVGEQILYYTKSENSKPSKLKLSHSLDFIYNMKSDVITKWEDLIPKEGYIEIIDNNRDGTYDVVKTYEYTDIQLSFADAEEKKLYDSEKGVIVDLSDYDTEFKIIKGNEIISVSDLKSDDILSIYESRDKSFVTIYASEDVFEGSVTRRREADDRTYLTVDKEYKVSKSCMDNVEAGYKGTFYLNVYGNIAKIEQMFGECDTYGYTFRISYDSTEDTTSIKMFTTNGFLELLTFAKSAKIDGVSKKGALEIYKSLCPYGLYPEAYDVNQPLRFKTDKKGHITLVDTLENAGGGDDDRFVLSKPKTTIAHKSNGVFSGDFAVGADTAAILVPSDVTGEEGYASYNASGFLSDKSYIIEAYSFDETRIPEFVLVFENNNSKTRGVLYVESASMVVDEDEDVYAEIKGFSDGALISVKTSCIDAALGLKCGDVISYTSGRDKVVNKIDVWYDIVKKQVGDAGGTLTSNEYLTSGYVQSSKEDIVLIADGSESGHVFYLQGINLYMVNEKNREIKKASWQEIKSEKSFGVGSLMFIYSNGGFTRSAMIIE